MGMGNRVQKNIHDIDPTSLPRGVWLNLAMEEALRERIGELFYLLEERDELSAHRKPIKM